MILYIDTTKDHKIEVIFKVGEKQIIKKKISAKYAQAEKLLPLIDKILKEKKLKLKNIKKIEVENRGGSFTALRIGVLTANALGYALGVRVMPNAECRMLNVRKQRFDVVEPIYDREPNITVKKV
jgi:tRNA threonylcarbamoyladenosine biosynthesis protein TsaB